ncbi:hypothetical protein V1J52_12405 [Streptomyces sp. TRM 70351]|uniref:hypothetical protein n=1 Tax=Streptomyces sp. TRM 70351 TaxID=3116552 RepID=UPI002E7BE516|nr:hypothetical protein [Streptomyces sp. TRM 70351]MEE1928968.1 hypothetical protein [Streptomyces sp. TRM 70351]
MRTAKPLQSSDPVTGSAEGTWDTAEFEDLYESLEIYRVLCPDCAAPIALLADEETLPEHALCPTPWDPFGLTVCQGSGRAAATARPAGDGEPQEQDAAALLTLPAGLDWRTQPFSHAGGPGSRPVRRAPARR